MLLDASSPSVVRLEGRGKAATKISGLLVRDIPVKFGFKDDVWTLRDSGLVQALGSIWTGERFLVVKGNGTLRTSLDGITWSGLAGTGNANYSGIIDGGGGHIVSIAAAAPWAYYSSDHGVTWQTSTGAISTNYSQLSTASNKTGTFVSINMSSTTYSVSTDNGANWSTGALAVATAAQSTITWTGNMFVIFAYGDTNVLWSTTGLNGSWTNTSVGITMSCVPSTCVKDYVLTSFEYSGASFYSLDTSSGIPRAKRMDASLIGAAFKTSVVPLTDTIYSIKREDFAFAYVTKDYQIGNAVTYNSNINTARSIVTNGSIIISVGDGGSTIYSTPIQKVVPIVWRTE